MNTVSDSFSAEAKEMIGLSKELAISLGYDRISTLHFFLANCQVSSDFSLKDFVFANDEHFHLFMEHCRLRKPAVFTNSPVPLTHEAEKALRTAVEFWFRRYPDTEIKSYHIMLAAGNNAKSFLAKKLGMKSSLQRRFEQYYIEKGIFHERNIKRNFWEKFLRK